MDFHLERGLRLHTEPKHKNLYSWAINEIDADGQPVGPDQIPWDWTLNFTATSCELSESIAIEAKSPVRQTPLTPPEIVQREVIVAKLRPGAPQDEEDAFRTTKFSMFGTDRIIRDFQLSIYPITNPADQESCSASGIVSYTAEIDFLDETFDDCILFYLLVKPETFTRYASKIAHGSVDEMTLSVRLVSGFYSSWSPSGSTHDIKVLTHGDEQQIELPPGHQVEPPRLGDIGATALYINRRLEFGNQAPKAKVGNETPDFEKVADPAVSRTLGSLRRALWLVVWLLAALLIIVLSKR